MKVLNLMTSGYFGGIEVLCDSLQQEASYENFYIFFRAKGPIYERMVKRGNVIFLNPKNSFFKNNRIIRKYILDNNIDIVVNHYNDFLVEVYYLIALRKIKKVKGVCIIHSCYSKPYTLFIKNFIWEKMRITVFKKSKRVVFVSNAGKKSYDKLLRFAKESRVIYNGISNDVIERGMKNFCKFDKPRILYLGRIEEVKGIHLLIGACSLLKKENIDFCCTIVGEGTQKRKLQLLTQNLKLSNEVLFCEGTNNVADFYENNNIFVYPSTWEEIFGISIVEAMAFGMICVSHKVGGIKEIITDNKNGFFSFEKTEESLYKTLKNISKDLKSEKVHSLSEEAKQTAQKFSIKVCAKEYKALFSEIISKA
jgi:glycosyltransferase involved in cell wall biosynthesis